MLLRLPVSLLLLLLSLSLLSRFLVFFAFAVGLVVRLLSGFILSIFDRFFLPVLDSLFHLDHDSPLFTSGHSPLPFRDTLPHPAQWPVPFHTPHSTILHSYIFTRSLPHPSSEPPSPPATRVTGFALNTLLT